MPKETQSAFLSVNLPPSLCLRQGHPNSSIKCQYPVTLHSGKLYTVAVGLECLFLCYINEEGHYRKVAVGKTSGRNKFPRIKGLSVQPRGSSGCSSEQTSNSLDESLQFFFCQNPTCVARSQGKGWSKEREGKLKKEKQVILKRI